MYTTITLTAHIEWYIQQVALHADDQVSRGGDVDVEILAYRGEFGGDSAAAVSLCGVQCTCGLFVEKVK